MKKLTTLLLTILTCILITGCGSSSEVARLERQVEREEKRADEYSAMVEELKAENAELEAEINSLNVSLKDYKDEVESLESQKETSNSNSNQDGTIKKLKDEIADLKEQLSNAYDDDAQYTIDALNSKIDSLNSQIASKNNEIYNLKVQLDTVKNNSYSSSNNATINNLQNQINILTLDLQNYKTVAATLQQQLDAQIAINKNQSIQSAYSSYVAIKFWSNGKTYYTKKNVWYSDSYCSKKLSSQDIIITSPTIDRFEASNGYTVYCCMSNVGLVYTSSKPSLLEVKNN